MPPSCPIVQCDAIGKILLLPVVCGDSIIKEDVKYVNSDL